MVRGYWSYKEGKLAMPSLCLIITEPRARTRKPDGWVLLLDFASSKPCANAIPYLEAQVLSVEVGYLPGLG